MTQLKFTGDWSSVVVFVIAFVLAAAAWTIYSRELRVRSGTSPLMKKLLMALRSGAVFLLVLMLAGPVLKHTQRIGELARLIVVADASQSMNLRDSDVDTGRKLLIAKRLGWLDAAALDDSSARAADAMLRVADVARTGSPAVQADAETAKKIIERDAVVSARIQSEILDAANALKNVPAANPQETKDKLGRIVEAATSIEQTLRANFASQASATNDARVQSALARFDKSARWMRIQELLFDGENSAIKKLSESHDVELKVLRAGKLENVWSASAGRHEGANASPTSLGGVADAKTTDLNLAMLAADDANNPESATGAVSRATAIVLLTDGKHNAGESPVQRAKILGSRGIHLFTVGLGGTNRAGDMAIAGVVNPKQVFVKDRVKGAIRLKDDLPSGRPFTAKITVGDEVIWERELTSQGVGLRSVDVDFPVEQLAEKLGRDLDKSVKQATLPIEAMVTISQAEGDAESDNNSWPMRFSVSLQKHRMLMIESRARWDWRYIKNMFARDEQWEVTSVIAENGELPRGKPNDAMPDTREAMFGYDLIYLGDVPAKMFRTNELSWIREFVGDRAGGLIVMDGARKELKSYVGGELGPLFPVEWVDGDVPEPKGLQLTKAGESFNAFAGVFTNNLTKDASAKPHVLAPPKWIAHVKTLPGAETLAEVMTASGSSPALVFRRFGAGKVFYTAFDESWRWRVPEPELYHQRYWRQLALAIMEPPFAARDARVSLDTDAMLYRPGDSALMRVRLRDEKGRPLEKADAYALLAREGQVVASFPLTPDPAGGGLFYAKSSALAAGDYEVRVAVDGVADTELKARTSFRVASVDVGELTDLGCDEPLLRQLAANANGGYFREENFDDVIAKIAPLSSGRVIESETVLWQSWWWFAALIGLLTSEWILRKRSGLI